MNAALTTANTLKEQGFVIVTIAMNEVDLSPLASSNYSYKLVQGGEWDLAHQINQLLCEFISIPFVFVLVQCR